MYECFVSDIKYAGWKNIFQGFKLAVVSQNFASNHADMHQAHVKEFIVWCELRDIRHIILVKSQDLYEYLEYIRTRFHKKKDVVLSDNSIKHHLLSLRMLFDYCYASGMIDYTVPFPKFQPMEQKAKKVLDVEQIKMLFDVCENPRDLAILSLAYGCGMRRSEMYKLNSTDVHTHEQMIFIKEGKGRKYRTIPLSKKVLEFLRNYEIYYRPQLLMNRGDYYVEPAFLLNNHGHRLCGMSIYKRLRYLADKIPAADLSYVHITPHYLRHCIASHLIERGAGLEWTQAFLGHGTPDATHVYIKNRNRKVIF